MTPIPLHQYDISLRPDCARVIIRPFIPVEDSRVTTIIGRALELNENEAVEQLCRVRGEFELRHHDIDHVLMRHYEKVAPRLFTQRTLSLERQLLIGALFSGEYALECAALFNPSMVPHPDQENLPEGSLRFMMSLRATGEGHISSIEFREGTVSASGEIELVPVSRFVGAPDVIANPGYRKNRFTLRLHDLGVDDAFTAAILAPLAENFTRNELNQSLGMVSQEAGTLSALQQQSMDNILWYADSNYELRFCPTLAMSERMIFPVSLSESNGIEDARFVRFVEDDGSVMYYATYTAYNGRAILPQLIETEDFCHFRILTLHGSAVKNKGMALFPRRIGGRYVMLSRQDDENLSVMFSESPHRWNESTIILRPAEMWESGKVGNCGSPIETEKGWLVITHGVGPMRKYCIGAALLDLDDPTKVLGRLEEPLIVPELECRDGYVPNVVYSCGCMLHGTSLIIPYAMNDRVTTIASVELEVILTSLLATSESGLTP
jgi:predicted GH43/DUF377 family glycosyl hydrolase